MNLQQRVDERQSGETFHLRVVDGYYDIEKDGYNGSMPIIRLFGHDENDEWRHVAIDGYRPYFLVPKEEYQLKAEEIESDRRVLGVTDNCRNGLDPDKVLEETELVKIIVECPWHVRDLRDHFGRVWEADIRFVQRFLVDCGITSHAKVSGYTGPDDPINQSNIVGTDEGEAKVRTCTYDIEVLDEGEDVVTKGGTERAKQPITAVTAHDSFADEYKTWALDPGDWPSNLNVISNVDLDVPVSIDIYKREDRMLDEFVSWLVEKKFDVLTGWSSNRFDTPYLVNRCFEQEVWTIRELSPTREVERCHGEGQWVNSDVNGVHCFDLLEGFKKTSFHSLKSNSLSNVAAEVTDVEKLDLSDAIDAKTNRPTDEAWYEHPSTFLEYSVRDVVATVKINEARGIL